MSFAALALSNRAANDTTRAQINNIPSKSHVIPLFINTYTHIIIHIKHSGRPYARDPPSHFKIMTSAIQDIVSLVCNILAPVFKMDGKHVTRIGDHNFKSVDHLNARFEYYNGCSVLLHLQE